VFFTHRGELNGAGVPGKVSLFDARAGGGFLESSSACAGTGCQGVPPAPPGYATPASSTFTGIGNFVPSGQVKVTRLTRAQRLAKALKACKRRRRKGKRLVCERQARKQYGAAKAKGKSGGKAGRRASNGRTR
jgi:hypothetical protein